MKTMPARCNQIIRLLVTFCIAFVPVKHFAQNPAFRFENLTSEDGLTDRIINAIIQDSKGYIWIGSEEGLTKYDGYTCVAYRHEQNNPHSLADNEVRSLCIDKDGALWIGTRNGLSRYDAVYDRFENFYHDDNVHSLGGNEVFAMEKDNAGNLWIGTYGNGLDMLQQNTSSAKSSTYSFKHYRHSEPDSATISSDQVFSISSGSGNDIWIGTAKGLNLLNTATGKLTRFYKHEGDTNAISQNMVTVVYADNNGYTWVCGQGMLDRVRKNTGTQQTTIEVQHYLPLLINGTDPGDWSINSVLADKQGNTWIATNDQGLIKLKAAGNNTLQIAETFTRNKQSPFSLVNSIVFSLFEDRSGVIWIGTAKGLSKYIPSKSRFLDNTAIKYANAGDGYSIMSLLCDNQNRLWIGYDFDTIAIIQKEGKQYINIPFAADASTDQVNAMYQSSKGDIYIATLRNGVLMLPAKERRWVPINKATCKGLPSNNVYSVMEDKTGVIWFGTYKGLCSYNAATQTAEDMYTSPKSLVASEYIIRTLYADANNLLWCGTDNGLAVFKNRKLFKTFYADEHDTTSLSNNRIAAIFEDKQKRIWIGTKDGLNLYHPSTNNFTRFTRKNGLPAESIMSMLEDSSGSIWMGTNHGLVILNHETNSFRHFGISDGIPSDEFILNAAAKDEHGDFYFGTTAGLIAFKPGMIVPNAYIPPVEITGVKILDAPINALNDTALINNWRREKKLLLNYNENFFSFEFAALNYINTSANSYAYMLEGVDPHWNYSGTQRFARYTDIKPGSYTFKVKAANNDGLWNPVPLTVEVIISPPWWQTWWFYTLCAVAFCAVIYTIYIVRLKQVLKLYKLRSSIAKDLHDDVGSALSSIAMLSRIAQDGKTNANLQPEEIFARIGDTSKRMIDLMDDIVWSVNPDNDRFTNMLIRMREYTVEMLEANNIEFTFRVSDNMDELKLPMQMRKDYFLIFKEAINNLAKYSKATHAAITVERNHRVVITTVADDGAGFTQHTNHSGNGLKNMHERATALKGTLEIKTGCTGTSVTLHLPVT